jgi:hypothetical protein
MESVRVQTGRKFCGPARATEGILIDIHKTVGGNTQTRRASLCDASPKRAADVSKPSGAHDGADELHPAEHMPVGDPRPQNE